MRERGCGYEGGGGGGDDANLGFFCRNIQVDFLKKQG